MEKNEINTVFRPNQAFPHPNRPVRFKIAKSDFQYFFQIINEIQWIVSVRTYNAWLTFDILVNHSFSIFNTISFFNPYALLYSHVVKVQRSKLFITSTSWMFRPMSACKQYQPWSEVNEHAQDLDRRISNGGTEEVCERAETKLWPIFFSLWESDHSRSTNIDKLIVHEKFSEGFQNF